MQFFNRRLIFSILSIGLASPFAVASPLSVGARDPAIILPVDIWAITRTFLHGGDALRLIFGVVQVAEDNGQNGIDRFRPMLSAIVTDLMQPSPPEGDPLDVPRLPRVEIEMSGNIVNNPGPILNDGFANARNSDQLLPVIQNLFRASAQATILTRPNGSIRGISDLDIPERLGIRSEIVRTLLNQHRDLNRLDAAERASLAVESGRMMVHGAVLGELGRWTLEQLLLEDNQTGIPATDRANILVNLITNGHEHRNLIVIHNFVVNRWHKASKTSDPTLTQLRQLAARLVAFMIKNYPKIPLLLSIEFVNDLLVAATKNEDEVLAEQAQLIQKTYFAASKAKKEKAEKKEN